MLVPLKELQENPEKYGFKKCKKPYYNCWYRCFARGVKMIFLSKHMIDIIPWEYEDPRIHSRANCRYRDDRTAEDYLCELITLGLVNTHYSKPAVMECIESAECIIKDRATKRMPLPEPPKEDAL